MCVSDPGSDEVFFKSINQRVKFGKTEEGHYAVPIIPRASARERWQEALWLKKENHQVQLIAMYQSRGIPMTPLTQEILNSWDQTEDRKKKIEILDRLSYHFEDRAGTHFGPRSEGWEVQGHDRCVLLKKHLKNTRATTEFQAPVTLHWQSAAANSYRREGDGCDTEELREKRKNTIKDSKGY